ncbi:MAG: AI-2E family transporter [Candidatus Berkiellales bacterium]
MTGVKQALITVGILLGLTVLCLIIYQLTPVLIPFIVAAALAYLTDPLVEWASTGKYKIPRTLAVIIVFVVVIALLLIALLFLLPALQRQLVTFVAAVPAMLDWFQLKLVPQLMVLGLAPKDFGLDTLRAEIVNHTAEATQFAKWLWQTLFHSGAIILTGILNLLITLVAAFYLLRDWHAILKAMESLIPRSVAPTALSLLKQCDMVMSTFVRGQLWVMIALGTLYSVGLAIIGVNFSLLLGMMAGLLSIVPYLGTVLGLGSALLVAYLQFDTLWPVLGVLVVFGIGHILEMAVLAPMLIGDKLGLHPVAVIFAILAGGHLLGLAGVILAIPLAAIFVVLMSELLNKFQKLPRAKVT